MKILFKPQVRLNEQERIIYEFGEDIITATLSNGESDTFDFTDLPDGKLEVYDEDGICVIESSLETNVIVSAKRESGILSVELLNWIGVNATEAERFPDWIDHTEYVAPSDKK